MTSPTLSTIFITAATILCGCSGNPDVNRSGEAGEIKSHEEEGVKIASFYTVDKYDPQADPAVDLVATVAQASTSGKRIILEIGGNW